MKTSPTLIGLGLVMTVLLRDHGVLTPNDAQRLAARMLDQLEPIERHDGFWCTWYDLSDVRGVPAPSPHLPHFVSSVDNGNLTTALHIAETAFAASDLGARAEALLQGQDYRRFLNPGNGLVNLGWSPENGAPSPFDYGTLNSEARLAALLSLRDGAPASVWTAMDASPLSVPDGQGRIVPIMAAWGGSLFETLMVEPLLNGAATTSPVWAENARRMLSLHAAAAEQRGWTVWGWSPAFDVFGAYREFGVPALAAAGPAGGYPMGEASPYSAALGLRFAPDLVADNLARMRALNPDVYHPEFGYRDSIDPQTGAVSPVVSGLDKSMEALGLSASAVDPYFWASLERRGTAGPLREALTGVPPLPPIERDPSFALPSTTSARQ